jgi:hypothetical protein
MIGDGHGAIAVEEFFGGIDPESSVDGGMEVGDGDWAIDHFAA